MSNTGHDTYTQEKIMSAYQKSGFEIRADLLNQAQALLEQNRSFKKKRAYWREVANKPKRKK